NKIANESNSHDTKINTTIAKEIIKIRAEINNDLTAKINFCDANYSTEAQNIITMINDVYEKYNKIKQVLETYHNNFNQIVNEFEQSEELLQHSKTKSINDTPLSKA
ncbi:30826_t:CDS:1, partial [Gigaspora margarita]